MTRIGSLDCDVGHQQVSSQHLGQTAAIWNNHLPTQPQSVGYFKGCRVSVSQKTAKTIWGECGALCCICKKPQIKTTVSGVSLLGEIAHIVGETQSAARGQSPMTLRERNSAENLLLLCRDHHKEVDDHEDTYSVEHLLKVKGDHVQWVSQRLADTAPWHSNVSQLMYINIPRLLEQSAMQGQPENLEQFAGVELRRLGGEMHRAILPFKHVLNRLAVDALPHTDVLLNDSLAGRIIAVDRLKFRTKNINVDKPVRLTGKLSSDPHVYADVNGVRLVCRIDPQYITTNTAVMFFTQGVSLFSGLARVTDVDIDNGLVFATPLVLGAPN